MILQLSLQAVLAVGSLDGLVDIAKEAAAEHSTRVSHVAHPTKGRFGTAVMPALDPLLAALNAYNAFSEDEKKACTDAKDGTAEFPAHCAAHLKKYWPAARMALEATHAAECGLPKGLELFSLSETPLGKNGMMRLQHAARLGTWQARTFANQKQFAEAAAVCVDVFALARDSARDGGLLPHMIGVAITKMAKTPCGSVFDAAPAAVKTSTAQKLTLVQQGLAPQAEFLTAFYLESSLSAAVGLEPSLEKKLTPSLRAFVREMLGKERQQLAAEDAHDAGMAMFLSSAQYFSDLGKAVELPVKERGAALAAADAKKGLMVPSFIPYLKNIDERDAIFTELIARCSTQAIDAGAH